jgi:hypothetical protein
MTAEEKIKERLKIIKTWQTRLEKLRARKDGAMKESEFCRKYGFSKVPFNRAKNLKVIATQATIDRVEAAFKQEGV